jgi:hypothetical protein
MNRRRHLEWGVLGRLETPGVNRRNFDVVRDPPVVQRRATRRVRVRRDSNGWR